MTLAEQIKVILEAIDCGFPEPEDIVLWADSVIAASYNPPLWLIELSVLKSPRLADFESILRGQEKAPLILRQRIQVSVLAHDAGLLTLQAAVTNLLRVVMLDPQGQHPGALDEPLIDALVQWDCQEGADVLGAPLGAGPPESALSVTCASVFQEYLADAGEVAAVLPRSFRAVT